MWIGKAVLPLLILYSVTAHARQERSAEALSAELDSLLELKSERLRRQSAPFELLAHSSEELSKWKPHHVSHFLRVLGFASYSDTLHADAAMDGPAFSCWMQQLHAAVVGRNLRRNDTCAAAISLHSSAFSVFHSNRSNQWIQLQDALLLSPIAMQINRVAMAPPINCKQRFEYTAVDPEKLVTVLRHCGVVIVTGLLPQNSTVLQQLQALPSFVGPTVGWCNENETAVKTQCTPHGGTATREVLGALRGGRREVFLPLTNYTSELPTLMHRPPLTSILGRYLRGCLHQGPATAELELEIDTVVLVDADPSPASNEQQLHRDVGLVGAQVETSVTNTSRAVGELPFRSVAVQIPLVGMPRTSGPVSFCPRTHTGPRCL